MTVFKKKKGNVIKFLISQSKWMWGEKKLI